MASPMRLTAGLAKMEPENARARHAELRQAEPGLRLLSHRTGSVCAKRGQDGQDRISGILSIMSILSNNLDGREGSHPGSGDQDFNVKSIP